MEKLKAKHDHRLTDIIKVGIFALFLILPILCFLPSCIYYGFNEHATAQESDVQTTIETETTTALNYSNALAEPLANSDIEFDKMYLWDSRQTGTASFGGTCLLSYVNVIDYSNGVTISDDTTTKQIKTIMTLWTVYDSTKSYGFNTNNDYVVALVMISNTPTNWNNFYTGLKVPTFNVNQSSTSETTTTTTETTYTMDISNSIGQAWQSTWNTPLFAWTNNNTFNATINAFTQVFNITHESYITNYLTYILTITCVYLIFDIVLGITTMLTHMINGK